MDEKSRIKARDYLLRARLYRFVAICFVVAAIPAFFWLYFARYDAEAIQFLKDPMGAAYLLILFLPASFLAFLARKSEKKLMALLSEIEPGTVAKEAEPPKDQE